MPIDITMPRLSDTMEAGTIIKWNVKEGDKVSAGDVIADVETDKATMEMAVYDDGVISRISVPEGQKVNVGTVIAVLDGEGAGASKSSGSAAASAEPAATKKAAAKAKEAAGEDERGESRGSVAVAERPAPPERTPPAKPGKAAAEEPEEAAGDVETNGRLRISPAQAIGGAAQKLDWLPEKDRPVLAAAIRLRCAALITGDRSHFGRGYGKVFGGVTIHSPRSLAESLFA